MVAVGRVLLWTVALIAPGGFLLVPVLALGGGSGSLRERLSSFTSRVRSTLQRYWTKS
ncbi:MAG TPA: hypothetical protein VEX18_01925 [Polyangiaceae bacterium]|jgi:hypothetical protein|nr:hypothetical protein [Polyangiaceae bacterium]